MAGIQTNRTTTGAYLPVDLSGEIWSRTQEASAVMNLATQMTVPGNGTVVNMLTGDPQAQWVDETEAIPVGTHTQGQKKISRYKMGVILPFSNEFARDSPELFEAIVNRVPGAFAELFDGTVFGKDTKPGENFDQLHTCTAVDVKTDTWQGLVTADTTVAENNAILNGYAISPKMKSLLLSAKDGMQRPLFVNGIASDAIPMLLGSPTYLSRRAYLAGTPNQLGFGGDWTSARYAIGDGIFMSYTDQSTITIDGQQVNLWERDMFAIKFTAEFAFRCKDLNDFVRLTDATA